MGAEAEQGGLGLHRPGRVDEDGAAVVVLPFGGQVRQPPAQALDADELHQLQAGVDDLLAQLVGVMEVGGGEPVGPVVGIAVLPGASDARIWEPEPSVVYAWEKALV